MEAEFKKMIKEKEDNLKMAIVPLDLVPLSRLPSIGKTIAPMTSTQTPSPEHVT